MQKLWGYGSIILKIILWAPYTITHAVSKWSTGFWREKIYSGTPWYISMTILGTILCSANVAFIEYSIISSMSLNFLQKHGVVLFWSLEWKALAQLLGQQQLLQLAAPRCEESSKKTLWDPIGHIWVRFPRTGILAQMWSFFEKSRAFVWPNGLIFSSFLNCSEEIMSVRP